MTYSEHAYLDSLNQSPDEDSSNMAQAETATDRIMRLFGEMLHSSIGNDHSFNKVIHWMKNTSFVLEGARMDDVPATMSPAEWHAAYEDFKALAPKYKALLESGVQGISVRWDLNEVGRQIVWFGRNATSNVQTDIDAVRESLFPVDSGKR